MAPIDAMPTPAVLITCERAWGLTDLTFVRKMENIVYACNHQGQKAFLRLTTPFRRAESQIAAELHFIEHLANAGLTVPTPLQSMDGQTLLRINEDDQHYAAVVFAALEGEHPYQEHLATPTFLRTLGALIAKMHNVSTQYEPLSAEREHWHEERGLRHAIEAASTSPHTSVHTQLETTLQWIDTLPKTRDYYGLVHADLGAGNLFLKPDGTIGVIDFDDTCYHFYAFDLAIVIYSMAGRFEHMAPNDLEKTWLNHLLEGYRTVRPITEEQISHIPHFMHFACLRIYFWIAYHQSLNTFHEDMVEHVAHMKAWALQRLQHAP